MVIGIRPSHHKSTDLYPAQDTAQESPLTQDQLEALKGRIERPEEYEGAPESRNLLHQLLKPMIALDELLGGRPMTQRDRERLDFAGNVGITKIRNLVV